MSFAVIELNDTGVLVSLDGDVLARSPGFAVLDGERLMTGAEAYGCARLLPRWTNNRFWHQLSTEPIPAATPALRHHADLAFAHLEAIWADLKGHAGSTVFAVPPYYSREQLGLLLGMAGEAGMPVDGVVDSAVAAAAGQSLTNTAFVLDIYLHCMTLTQLGASVQLTRTDAVTVSDVGIFTLWDRWANIVANQFIQTTRYDPLHQADSEQALYNQIPEWIAVNDGQLNQFDLVTASGTPSVQVTRDQLLTACSAIYPQIVQTLRARLTQGERASIFLTHRLRGFPGLRDALALIDGVSVAELPESAVNESVRGYADTITGRETVAHVVTLPVKASRPETETSASAAPTHLLLGSRAVAIGSAFRLDGDLSGGLRTGSDPVCTLYTDGQTVRIDPHREGITVNGSSPPGGTALATGDTLRVADTDLTLISVT